MSSYGFVVLEHFRHPRNRRRIERADASVEGANQLCGDRIRLDVRLHAGMVAEAAFTADACALCIASASLLTDHVRGMRAAEAEGLDDATVFELLGPVPAARLACVMLPLETLRRAIREGVAAP